MNAALFVVYASLTQVVFWSLVGIALLYFGFRLFVAWKNSPARWWNKRG